MDLHLQEYRRPWKLATFACGVALMIVGVFYPGAPDWDIPVTLIMTTLTYLCAPWSMRVILGRKWRLWPVALFLSWLVVDGSYSLYWHFRDPRVLQLMREANAYASFPLYWLCGAIWLYRGSLRQLWTELRGVLAELRGQAH